MSFDDYKSALTWTLSVYPSDRMDRARCTTSMARDEVEDRYRANGYCVQRSEGRAIGHSYLYKMPRRDEDKIELIDANMCYNVSLLKPLATNMSRTGSAEGLAFRALKPDDLKRVIRKYHPKLEVDVGDMSGRINPVIVYDPLWLQTMLDVFSEVYERDVSLEALFAILRENIRSETWQYDLMELVFGNLVEKGSGEARPRQQRVLERYMELMGGE